MTDSPEPNTYSSSDTPTPPGIPSTPAAARRTRVPQIVAGALIVAAVVLLLRGLLTPVSPTGATPGHAASSPAATATAAPADPLVGHYAPEVTLRDLRDKPTPLSSLRGKVVLLNFWYASCFPCQIEMPALEHIYLAHRSQGFEVVGIDTVDDAATISEYTSRLGITYPMLSDIGERAWTAYQVRATPSSFLIDRNGVIRAVYAGPVNTSTFQQQLTTLLAPAG
jgi:peroxiredoxin